MNAHDSDTRETRDVHARRIALAAWLARSKDLSSADLDKIESELMSILGRDTHDSMKGRRIGGRFAGVFDVGPEFFEPLPEKDLKAWEGE